MRSARGFTKSTARSITAAISSSGSVTRTSPRAQPAREKIGGERHVTVSGEALRELERVLHQAVTLVQDDDRARGRFALGKIELAFAAAAERGLHLRSRRKSACQRLSHVSHSLRSAARSMMRNTPWSNAAATLRLTGTRLCSLMIVWPSGESTKSAKRSA